MILPLHEQIRRRVRAILAETYDVRDPDLTIALETPPNRTLGDLGTPVAFDLARRLRKAPRLIAQEIAGAFPPGDGVARVEAAANGYLNVFLDRPLFLLQRLGVVPLADNPRTDHGKTIVEHTAINPNKAAHIGHLRNSALGDTLVRVLSFRGTPVEVQNYIDDTGVQVADVVVGFRELEGLDLAGVRQVADTTRFDYYCWDLYARVTEWYEGDKERLKIRGATLHDIEHGASPVADIASFIAERIVRCHLKTMARLNIDYHLLTWEGDILRLKFWARAFEVLKQTGAVYLQTSGRLAGCWVMKIDSDSAGSDRIEGEGEGREDREGPDAGGSGDGDPGSDTEDREKVIVRSNGTVTYVGKDIAYQLWKLGLLEKDFYYRHLDHARNVWVTDSSPGERIHPAFGHGHKVYNVIDVRQSYLQNVVRQGLLGLGYADQVQNSIHFHYEVVALTPACAEELGVELSAEDSKRSHIEVSGRKGQGVKADDLLNRLETDARQEVLQRNEELTPSETEEIAHQIAVGALRYFLLRFTRNAIIAFDFKEALNFDGDTGPYLQYATVRANNIVRKIAETDESFSSHRLPQYLAEASIDKFLDEADDIWELVYTASRLDEVANQVISTLEPASLAKYTFTLAQRFSLFYHRYRIIAEADADRRTFYLCVVELVRQTMTKSLDMMGIQVPRRM
jgi:arginyl-tRNA synthetase